MGIAGGCRARRRPQTTLYWYQKEKEGQRCEDTLRSHSWGRLVRDKHLGAHSRRCALAKGHFMQKKSGPMDSGLHIAHGERGKPQGTAAHEGQGWRLYTEKHREGGMPGTEQVAAVRNSYTPL